MKTCTRCRQTKPATTEFFYANARYAGGLTAECRSCYKTRREERKEEIHEYNLKRYAEHREERCAASRAYSSEHREERRAYNQQWRTKNTDHLRSYREANRERIKTQQRAYRLAHLEYFRAVTRGMRAKRAAATGIHTSADVRAQYERQHGRCYWCKEKVGDDYHVDHVIPLAKGGSNGPENLVIACPSCNLRKSMAMPHEFSDRLC